MAAKGGADRFCTTLLKLRGCKCEEQRFSSTLLSSKQIVQCGWVGAGEEKPSLLRSCDTLDALNIYARFLWALSDSGSGDLCKPIGPCTHWTQHACTLIACWPQHASFSHFFYF